MFAPQFCFAILTLIVILLLPPVAPAGSTFAAIGLSWTNDYYYDIVAFMALSMWLLPILGGRRPQNSIQVKTIKTYLYLLIMGLLSVVVGVLNGNDHLFWAYRLFAYFIWVPFIIEVFSKKRRAVSFVRVFVVLTAISVAIALSDHVRTYGFELHYLNTSYAFTLTCAFILVLSLMTGAHLFKSPLVSYLLYSMFMLALIIDPSRRMYIAVLFGHGLVALYSLKGVTSARRLLLKFIAALTFVLATAIYLGVFFDAGARLSSIHSLMDRAVLSGSLSRDRSLGYRSIAVSIGVEKIMEHPVLGIGTGYDEELMGVLRDVGKDYKYEGGSPHNFWITSMRHFGVPVVILFVVLIAGLVKKVVRTSLGLWTANTALEVIAVGAMVSFISQALILAFTGYGSETTLGIWITLGCSLGAVVSAQVARKTVKTKA